MRKRVEQAASDPDLLSLRHDIGVAIRYREILESRLETEPSVPYAALAKVSAELLRAQSLAAEGDTIAAELRDALIVSLCGLVEQGATAQRAWDEALEHQERVAKLMESESRLVEKRQGAVPVLQVMAIISKLVSLINVTVTDRQQLSTLSRGIEEVITFVPQQAPKLG